MAKSIAFIHHKGGTGKTTSCINIAGYLAKAGKRVLVVDLDPQGNSTAGLGINKNLLQQTIANVFLDNYPLKHTILKTDFDNIHLVPSNSDLAYVELNTKSGWLIKQSLEQVKGNYDYILIDTPPNFGRLMISGIVASNHIIVAMDPGIFALEGMQDLQVVLENIKKETNIPVNISALLLTKVEKSFFGKNPSKEIEQSLRNEWGEKAFSVPKDNSVYESQLLGMPLSHYRPYSKAGNMYRTIAEEIMRW